MFWSVLTARTGDADGGRRILVRDREERGLGAINGGLDAEGGAVVPHEGRDVLPVSLFAAGRKPVLFENFNHNQGRSTR